MVLVKVVVPLAVGKDLVGWNREARTRRAAVLVVNVVVSAALGTDAREDPVGADVLANVVVSAPLLTDGR
jgi:hypothetical protein